MLKRRHGSILKRHGSDKRRRASSSSVEVELLPHDVIELILERLAVESLRRFRSVSKKWRSTIDSPRFQSRQLNLRRQSRGHDLLFVAYYEDPPDDVAPLALGSSSSSCIYRTVKFPFPNLLLCYGSCDGLVCLFCIHPPNVVVNPATRWHRSFPFSSLQRLIIDKGRPPFASDLTYELGFGKDKLSGTYKPVWLYNSSEYGLDNVTTCEVFDFSTHSWRNLVPSLFDRYGLVPLPVAILEKNKLYLHGRGYLEPLMLHDLHSQSYELVSTPTIPGDCIYYFESLFSV